MPLTDIPFGSLRSREAVERIPLSYAIDASDCVLDADTIEGRSGYRSVTPAAIGSGLTQGVWRFRPASDSARTVVVRGGSVWIVTDPSSETAVDGVATLAGAVFGATAQISGVQVGKYLYLGSDLATDVWQRVKPDYTLEAFTSLAKITDVNFAPNVPPYIFFTSLTAPPPATTGAATVTASGVADWRRLDGNIGDSVTYTLAADFDASGCRWLFVSASPNTSSTGDGSFRIEVATAAGAFESLVTMFDTPGDDSPYVVYCSLIGITAATRSAIRRIRFVQVDTTNAYFNSGFSFIPSPPALGEVTYFISLRNSVTGQESVLSDPILVVYSSDDIVFASFPAARVHGGTLISGGSQNTNPDTFDTASLFNNGAGLASPHASDFAPTYTFTNGVTMPPGSYDRVRLWRQTATGIRLVKEVPATPGAPPLNGFTVVDDTGDATLTHQLYVPGGTPPPCLAMGALGGRIICGGDPANPNRLTVSTYLAFGATTDPFPQFPAVPTSLTDGWTVDISPTTAEQILWIGEGDKTLYISTNEALYGVNDLTAPLFGPPNFFQILERGVIGRRAAMWAEDRLFWSSFDGQYTCVNRASWDEMTGEVRAIYNDWLQADPSVVVGYKNRKFFLIRGTRCIRYDFVTNTWTRHTYAHAMQHMAFWRDPTGTVQHLWFLDSDGFLDRFQDDAPDDRGVPIADWTYSTGFDIQGAKTRLNFLFADVSDGVVTISAFKDAAATGPPFLTWTTSGEHEYTVAPYKASAAGNDATGHKWRLQLVGDNVVSVRRLMWDRSEVDARGK